MSGSFSGCSAGGYQTADDSHIGYGFGEPLKPAYKSATLRTYVRSHGLDCTYHALRHTAASLMLASGTDVRTVAGRLGHASATTTLQTYSHLIGQADRDAAERLEAILNRSG
jgi:integrase